MVMGKKIIIWTGFEFNMPSNKTPLDILKMFINGELSFDVADSVRITSKTGKTLLKKDYPYRGVDYWRH
jgi:hypothetical protein